MKTELQKQREFLLSVQKIKSLCPNCGENFSSEGNLVLHEGSKENMVQCPQCNLFFDLRPLFFGGYLWSPVRDMERLERVLVAAENPY